jgi:hypothetical protein
MALENEGLWGNRLNELASDSGPPLHKAIEWLREARFHDPTESGLAAWVRDAIRDNYDPDLDDDNPALWAELEG